MEVAVYIINSSLWSAGGFLVGYHISKLRREVNELHEEIEKRDSEEH